LSNLWAREQAIALTDRFAVTPGEDPTRDDLWQHVVRQTDTARLLLERWLRSGQLSDQTHPNPFDFQRYSRCPQ
jgi:hypothetical protein